MNQKNNIKEMLLLSHIYAISNTIFLNKNILLWLKQCNIIFVWELYTSKFDIERLKATIPIKNVVQFRSTIESLFGNLDIKLSPEEIRDLYIKSHSESFRFDLTLMTTSFEDIRKSYTISTRLFNILTDSVELKYIWMLYETKHTVTTEKPFKPTFLLWRGTSPKMLEELDALLIKLELPELDSIEFTENELSILENI